MLAHSVNDLTNHIDFLKSLSDFIWRKYETYSRPFFLELLNVLAWMYLLPNEKGRAGDNWLTEQSYGGIAVSLANCDSGLIVTVVTRPYKDTQPLITE